MKSAANNKRLFAQADYAKSLHGNAQLIHLPHVDGWVVRRSFKGHGVAENITTDLSNPYPMFSCLNLQHIKDDIKILETSSDVSLTLRTDVFDEAIIPKIRSDFDFIRPFKTHYIAELSTPWREFASRNCRRYAAKAEASFQISRVMSPPDYAASLLKLNQTILKRVDVAFNVNLTEDILRQLLALPEVVLFDARNDDGLQGLALYMRYGDNVYAHTLGVTDQGRSDYAVYGLYGHALDYFQDNARAIDFGGNPGMAEDSENSIGSFKRAWSNKTQVSFICGKVLRPSLYEDLCQSRSVLQGDFFPAYRAPQ